MSLDTDRREELESRLRRYVGLDIGPPETALDSVNEPMIRHWCEIVEDRHPAYTDPEAAAASIHGGIVAPPTMLQAWVLPGPAMAKDSGQPVNEQIKLHRLLTECGYPSVVATNCEQHYHRYLRPGDRVSVTTTIEAISEQKATALGIGYFIDTRDVYRDQHGEEVGWMTFRVLKFTPAQPPQAATEESAAAKPLRIRPPLGHDNAWWWQGIDRGELLIQRCSGCGELRHPPRPMCGKCQSTEWTSIAAAGPGSVYSFVVMHHPKFPGYDYPIVCALIELAEGTRILSNVVGCEPGAVHIGMRVELRIEKVDDELSLPLFWPAR